MTSAWRLALVVVLIGTAAASPLAHHPYSATYLTDQQVTIDGRIVELVYRNPHAFIHVSAPDRDGQSRHWAVEWGRPGATGRAGIPTHVLQLGDRLVVSGSPARDPAAFRILGRTIVRPADGWRWAGPLF